MKPKEETLMQWWDGCHSGDEIRYLTGSRGEDVWRSLNIIDKIVSDMVVLNIGVGLGDCTRSLVNRKAIVHALDISEVALNRVQEIVTGIWMPHQLASLPSDVFDLAISHLVTQHMKKEDLLEQMREVIRSLKPQGIFAMQFSYSLSKDYSNDESVEILKEGRACHSLAEMHLLVCEAGGRLVWANNLGVFPDWNMGWYGVHIIKNNDSSLRQYQLAEHNRVLAESFNREGKNLEKLGNLNEALSAFSLALEWFPSYAEAYYNVGSVLKSQRDWDGAVEYFEKALRFNPVHRESVISLASILRAEWDFDGAIQICESYFLKNLQDPQVKTLLAVVRLQKESFDRSPQCSEEESQRRSEITELILQAGETLLKEENDLDGAKSAFLKALQLNPSCGSSYCNLGIIYLQEKKYLKALRYLRKAIELEPANILFEANYHQALLFVNQMKVDVIPNFSVV